MIKIPLGAPVAIQIMMQEREIKKQTKIQYQVKVKLDKLRAQEVSSQIDQVILDVKNNGAEVTEVVEVAKVAKAVTEEVKIRQLIQYANLQDNPIDFMLSQVRIRQRHLDIANKATELLQS